MAGLLDLSLLDQASSWFWGNLSTIADLLIVVGAVTSSLAFLIRRRMHPNVSMESKVATAFDVWEMKQIDGWMLNFDISNHGFLSETAQNTKLTLHAIDMVGMIEKGPSYDGSPTEKNVTIFEGLDIIPEKGVRNLPLQVQFAYYADKNDRFTLAHFAKGFTSRHRGVDVESFRITRSTRYPQGSYMLTFQFSGSNLCDRDRLERGWTVKFPLMEKPVLEPFIAPSTSQKKTDAELVADIVSLSSDSSVQAKGAKEENS